VCICCLCIFLAACSVEHDGNGEADSTGNEVGEAGEVLFENDDTEIVGEAGDFDIENTTMAPQEELFQRSRERADFDWDNTFSVIQHSVNSSNDWVVGSILSSLVFRGIKGAIRAEFNDPLLEIESEDNRIYHIYFRPAPTDPAYAEDGRVWRIEAIIDMQTNRIIYGLPLCGGPIPPDDFQHGFDVDNTLLVMRVALGIDPNSQLISWAARRFWERNIRGAINAEVIGTTENGGTLLKIETEDNKFYVLRLSERYGLISITDYETGEIIEQNRER